MTPKEADFSLDDSAQQLYQQLAGLDTSVRSGLDNDHAESGLIDFLGEEEKWLDHYRIILADVVCLLAEILQTSRLSNLSEQTAKQNALLFDKLKKLTKLPQFDGKIQCRHKGRRLLSEKPGTEELDFELSTGNLLLDLQMARVVSKRRGAIAATLHAGLTRAFKTFKALEIVNLQLDIRLGTPDDLQKISSSLALLCRYYKKTKEKQNSDFIVVDEYGLPSPNLTLLAATNNVKPEAIQSLVHKIKPMIFGEDPAKELANFTTVYDAFFAFKKLRDQLSKPPFEINNLQRFMQTPGNPQKAAATAKITRMVIAEYGAKPEQASQVLASLNREGYQNIYTGTLRKRLSMASDFIQLAEKRASRDNIEQETISNIEQGLNNIGDDIFDDIDITGTEVSSTDDQGQTVTWRLHKELPPLLSFFKRRAAIKKKMQEMPHRQVEFDAQDYAVIARNFQIDEQAAQHLVSLLQACFDGNGHFRRSSFEKNIPEFIKFEAKVFEFLWHYLKELISRDDRVSFLNALQGLIAQLKDPQKALEILLRDIFCNSHLIGFSDRNGLLLANILIRKYNQELGSHIELTPEEVLQVREGLDPIMVEQAVLFLENEREQVYHKLKIIHEELQKTIAAKTASDKKSMPLRYLTTLERELIIFLSLTGGDIAHKIVRGLTKEYGDPKASLYLAGTDASYFRPFLQVLQVAARGLRRFDETKDLSLFQVIADQQTNFSNLSANQAHITLVKRVMDWMQ
ncbi:MAG: hypothetical protein OEY01_09165 [Desulfobulbaceae bacterium]|nr:hypothetical protein [Desulfobulbaceae bacterium]HIJ79172.1 hypothetical protein [Deltaproteobacteria bacterium]